MIVMPFGEIRYTSENGRLISSERLQIALAKRLKTEMIRHVHLQKVNTKLNRRIANLQTMSRLVSKDIILYFNDMATWKQTILSEIVVASPVLHPDHLIRKVKAKLLN